MAQIERFASRWGLILAALGMAIGTGNIWRFPRVMAANGGGTFLIPWLIFLFSWSIPLLIVESAMGKKSRRGTIGAFSTLLGPRSTWKGAFVGFCTLAIGFYYCVVSGWCLYYLVISVTGQLQGADPQAVWDGFTGSAALQMLFLLVALAVTSAILWKGVAGGIEKVNKVLIPALFAILLVAAIRAVTLPGSSAGMEYLFSFELAELGNYRVWLEALSQSAWSTGAGYGLLLTYAAYMHQRQNIVFSAVTTGLGNNSASLLAGIALIPTVFAVLPRQEALETVTTSGPASTGITFIYFPQLLERITGGATVIMPLFFLGLTFAAVSSMISMQELAVRNLCDYGVDRHKAIGATFVAILLLGAPSALSLTFLTNQDWVWGLGLMVSGVFFATAARQIGARRFRDEWVNTTPGWRVGKLFTWWVFWLIPLQFVALIAWWFYQAIAVYDPDSWWNPLHPFSLGTVLVQWLVMMAIFLALNPLLARAQKAQTDAGEHPAGATR
jgi:NSS family neurotransmitter:Na+ symporter